MKQLEEVKEEKFTWQQEGENSKEYSSDHNQ